MITRNTEGTKKHLIHIGYPKAGSSFLQSWFQLHPNLAYESFGIAGYNNLLSLVSEACKGNNDNISHYVTSYEGLSIPIENHWDWYFKELSYKSYDFDEFSKNQISVCKILKDILPNGKVLFVTRGYKNYMISLYSQYIKLGGIHPFSRFIKGSAPGHLTYIDYDAIISMYSEAFGKENMIIMPYELLRDDQNKFISILEKRLGIKHVDLKIGIINPSLSPQDQYWYQKISHTVTRVLSLFGEGLYVKIYTRYARAVLKNKLNIPVKILKYFSPSKKQILEVPEKTPQWITKGDLLKNYPLYDNYKKDYF